MTQRLSIIIVGGGASGVLLAAHLLRDPTMDLRVTLIEKRAEIGAGIAYSARQQDHVLNVAAPNMSAFADDPDHFWRWLRQRGLVEGSNRFVFVRETVEEAATRGSDWRAVVDAMRPFNQRIWQNWSHADRVAFLEHIRPIWNIHRHRLPPLHQRLADAVSSGQVTLIAGKFLDVRRDGADVVATIRRKGAANTENLRVTRVYDCGGVSVDVEQSSNPVIRQLIADGAARADRLHIGLDVTETCQVVSATGTPAERLFAIGPLTRGTFFEIEAIPDIRVQCAELAERLLRHADRVLERRIH